MKYMKKQLLNSGLLVGSGAALAVLAASVLGFAQPNNAPPAPAQFAVLTKVGGDTTLPCRAVQFEFSDRLNHYSGERLRQLLKSRLPVAGDDAAIVNAISDLGWELISHSQAATATNPQLNSGTTNGTSEILINETWWFKHR